MALLGADAAEVEGSRVLRVLAIEPFYGGSHRAFLDGWRERSRHDFELVTMPDRHWKWRMRHGALTAAEEVRNLIFNRREWDVIWASAMLDLAAFRGLCPEVAALPTVLYFHENQLTYPWRSGGPAAVPAEGGDEALGTRDEHYAYTNFLAACAADRLWFNSAFHRDDWLGALPRFLARFPDFSHADRVERLAERSEVQSPGVQGGEVAPETQGREAEGFDVVWAARWEHDKNPEGLFEALRSWRRRWPEHWRDGTRPVKLHVLGQRFEQVPDAFVAARSEFADAIATWGFVEPDLYRRCLASADVFVSTAQHEFFGIAAAEAMAAGVHPLLPDRLAYPELVGADAEALYPSDDGATEAASLAERLAALYERHGSHDWPSRTRWSGLVDRYRWSQRIPVLDAALNSVVAHPG